MKNLKEEYTFWEIIGSSKKNLLCVEDILDIGKSKIKKRKDEVKLARFKNISLNEISVKEYHYISKSYKIIFNQFCKEFICKDDSILIKEFIDLFNSINFIFFIQKISHNKITHQIIRYSSYHLAKFINNFSKNEKSFILFKLLKEKSFESVFSLIQNQEKKTIPELLVSINYILENRFSQKHNIKIQTIFEASFSTNLSFWQNKKRLFNIIHILHFIENIDKELKLNIFFQLLVFRSILFFKNKYKLNEKLFNNLIKTSEYILKKIEYPERIKRKKIFEKKYALFELSNNYKRYNKFEIHKVYIPNKKIENFFKNKNYFEAIDLLRNEHSNLNNINDELKKFSLKMSYALIEFIICTKLKNKKLMSKTFKILSLTLHLQNRGFKYNSEDVINLLNNEDDLFNCVKILNDYFSKNVDFSLTN